VQFSHQIEVGYFQPLNKKAQYIQYDTLAAKIFNLLWHARCTLNSQEINESPNKQEDAMKTLATIIGTIAPATAFAASTPRVDDSGLFVWIFLGFCALIVIAQVMPAVLLMFGMAKGITGVVKDEMKGHKA
jgi:hypothetical protein